MTFNSYEFLLFFPLVTLIYFLIPHRFRWIHLLLSSCIFYMVAMPSYIFLLLFLIIFNFGAGIAIERSKNRKKRLIFILSICLNLGVLFLFKYFNFFTKNVHDLICIVGLGSISFPVLHLILPLALSFQTLSSISYLAEISRGQMAAEKHPGIYAASSLFFPKLINGPIERPQDILSQFRELHVFNDENLLIGLRLMLWGLFKKVVIADRLANYVNEVYAHPHSYLSVNLFLAAVFFSFQLYCDFSGYSDIAVGTARLMGFRLSRNFNLPFASKTMADFWRKWHISLSSWYNNYLFKPIFAFGNRHRNRTVIFALFTTFLLSGLWHGANWTFIVYGSMHGLVLIYEYLTRNLRLRILNDRRSWITNIFSISCVFLFSCFCWIFFRADSLTQAGYFIRSIGSMNLTHFKPSDILLPEMGYSTILISILFIVLTLILEHKLGPEIDKKWNSAFAEIAFCASILTIIIIFGIFFSNIFIYSKF
jgi:alginate O-acetyltransferase complex protein AlgI